MSPDGTPAVVRHAKDACAAIRSVKRLTSPGYPLPAPLVHSVLENLQCVGQTLQQALTQLADGLGKSLDAEAYPADGGADPEQSIEAATGHLTRAAQLAIQLGQELEQAQHEIPRSASTETRTRA